APTGRVPGSPACARTSTPSAPCRSRKTRSRRSSPAPPTGSIPPVVPRLFPVGHQGVLFIDRLPDRAAPLHGEVRADLAIVGGGLTGLTTAIAARERFPQRRVVLLEADRCGTGASGRNGGMALTGTGLDLDELEERLGLDRAKTVSMWLGRGLAILKERAR